MKDKIANVLSKFANSFDVKDWDGLKETLADLIECDYQDLRGTVKVVSRDEYVQTRKQALNHLKTQHLFSNFEISIDDKQAFCRLTAIIFRQDNNDVNFNSHVVYQFELTEIYHEWKIHKIKQSVLWNEGDASIHKGL